MAWNYTPFHYGSIAVIKYSRNRNEAAVTFEKWNGYFRALVVRGQAQRQHQQLEG